ncbi:unnamed protein product [Somion occarium]|uniref:Cytochrome P450 n=1 Tax=Somion occarium TaxID=3059160 RepID=A0ABP1DVU0_9APHY
MAFPWTLLFALAIIVIAGNFAFKRPKYPPGPRKHWLLGNLYDIPRHVDWDKLLAWKREFGDLVYLTAFGKSVLVLNSHTAVKDLLDKRAKNFSHRPQTVMAGELFGLGKSMALFEYNERYRELRKLTQQAFSPDGLRKYQDVQLDIVKLFLDSLRKDPNDFRIQTRLAVSRTILAVTYGMPVKLADEGYIADAELTTKTVTMATFPGAYLVDLLPFLKYLPSWFPGAGFKKEGEYGYKLISKHVTRPFNYVREKLAEGIEHPSFVSDLLSGSENVRRHNIIEDERWLEDVKWAAGGMFSAGVDTSYATILVFFILMARHPDVQERARAEIDAVTGGRRPVTSEDRSKLPYSAAVMKEVTRWHVVVPTGLFRRSGDSEVYNGQLIPANTIVVPCIWSLSQEVEDPERFDPERFLHDNKTPNPYEYIFGFGRRICPGRYLAEHFIFLLTANLLTFYNISIPKACPEGLASPSDVTFTRTLTSYPEPFACDIRPRSERHAEDVAAMVAD